MGSPEFDRVRGNGIRFRISVQGNGGQEDGYRPDRQDLDGEFFVLGDTHDVSSTPQTVEMWADKANTPTNTLDKIRNSDTPVLQFLEETGT